MNTTPSLVAVAPARTVAVIGAGRLGSVLARALVDAGFDVRGPLRRGERIPRSDIALLCVPDAAIAEAASNARPHAGLVGHVSGATGLDDVDFSVHPLQTFTGSEAPGIFRGIGAAIDGRTPSALALARALAEALGMRPVRIDDAHRAGYHAAASVASNLVLAVLDAAEQIVGSAGISPADARAALAPLVRQTVENWAALGADAALTGPIARGDEQTVARQRAAIAADDPALLGLFDALAAQTREIATRRTAAERVGQPAPDAASSTDSSESTRSAA